MMLKYSTPPRRLKHTSAVSAFKVSTFVDPVGQLPIILCYHVKQCKVIRFCDVLRNYEGASVD